MAYTVDDEGNRSTVTVDGNEVAREDGDLRELGTVEITVSQNVDISDLQGIDAITIIEDSNPEVRATAAQLDVMQDEAAVALTGTDLLEALSDLQVRVDYESLNFEGDTVAATTDVSFDITKAEDGTLESLEVSGLAGAIAASDAGAFSGLLAEADAITWTGTGSLYSGENTLTARANAVDTFNFVSSDNNATDALDIDAFDAGTNDGADVMDFTGWLGDSAGFAATTNGQALTAGSVVLGDETTADWSSIEDGNYVFLTNSAGDYEINYVTVDTAAIDSVTVLGVVTTGEALDAANFA